MSRDRAALGGHLRLAFAGAATTWAAMLSWRGFTELSARYLFALVGVGAVIALTGALARWRRLPGVLVVALQVVVAGALTCAYVADRPWPGDRFWAAIGSAVDAANTYASPVPETDLVSVQPLLVVGGLVAMLLVDLCAATLRRVPLAGLPLLVVYSVPVSLLGTGLSWWVFAATAAGFLMMLFLQEEEHLRRWGRPLDGTGEPLRRLSDNVRGSALAVGTVATATAVLVPLAIPTFSFSVFDIGQGRGGDGDITVTNPLADLRRDLVRGEDIDLVEIRTDDPSPDHLRISVLNRFSGAEFSAGDREVPTSNRAQGTVPALEGVDDSVARVTDSYDYDVSITDGFDSRWLPTQAPIGSIEAAGDWRFDESTMDFIAGDDDLSTAGLDYSFEALDVQYDDDALLRLDGVATSLPGELTDVPDDLSPVVESLSRQVTAGATTKFGQAVALQQWFRDDGNFTYSLAPEPPKVGVDALEAFLTEGPGGRTGYCEQFAAAMAVMARELDIPSRVAVGFLSPDRTGPDTYVYSAHDLHAWVELYFPGAGWVLFDPTPAARVDTPLPDYTNLDVALPDIPTATGSTESVERPTRSATAEPTRPTRRPEPTTASPDRPSEGGSSFPWLVVLLVVVGAVLLALLARLPAGVRARRREQRLAGGPEAVWEELRATMVDLRLPWPETRSPRETRHRVAAFLGRPGDERTERPPRGPTVAPEAAAALERIALAVERGRYARHAPVPPGALKDDGETCVASLLAGAMPRTRRRARWWPRSLFQRRPATAVDPRTDADAESELVGSRAEHL
ncbi:DUF3488 and transglutaminase-like domain-containing protein [Nocardioides marinquilinus]|uniref:DUF3488 and transglutaminase-like domain-containing protein n=1 Tax=Nocardioides marinquilinus TaxID=1210400 RepID=A0ABP9PSA6_9ACTN